MAEHHANLFSSDTFWTLIALIIFIAILIYLKVPQWLMRHLDERALRIEGELAKARQLREEAQQLLLDYQKKRAEVENEAKAIIEASQREAEKIAQEAALALDDYIERCHKLAKEKIAQAEIAASLKIRQKAADAAIAAAENIIAEVMDDKIYDKLFNESLMVLKEKIEKTSFNL